MERGNLHGPRVDEALEHEVESLTRGAPVEARVEPDRAMEDAGDGEPVPQSLIAELPDAEAGDEVGHGLSRGEVVARSELAIHLRPRIFPAGRAAILECAREEHAGPELLGQLDAIPDREYANVQQVWEALGGKREERDATTTEHEPPEAVPAPEPTREPARFSFRFDLVHRLAALPFGIAPESTQVTVDASGEQARLVARFGPWVVDTPLANVAATTTTGPYSAIKTIGPPHLSLADLGLTFATNGRQGLCIRFRNAVPGLAPTGLLRHPALTVTVEDVEGLARAIEGGQAVVSASA